MPNTNEHKNAACLLTKLWFFIYQKLVVNVSSVELELENMVLLFVLFG